MVMPMPEHVLGWKMKMRMKRTLSPTTQTAARISRIEVEMMTTGGV